MRRERFVMRALRESVTPKVAAACVYLSFTINCQELDPSGNTFIIGFMVSCAELFSAEGGEGVDCASTFLQLTVLKYSGRI